MQTKFNAQGECLLYLEKIRWGKTVKCPYCHSEKTHRSKNEQGRHFCYNCVKSFSVMVGTIFEDTRLELPIWFGMINAMLNNKTGLSAKQLSSQFSITLKTAWLTAMKIRCAMIDSNTSLHTVLPSDEKKRNKNYDTGKDEFNPEAMRMKLLGMLKEYVKTDPSLFAKKGFRSLAAMEQLVEHISESQVSQLKGDDEIISKDAYWRDIKESISRNYKSLSEKYLPYYLAEYEYKYNPRNKKQGRFTDFIKNAVLKESPMPNHKSIKRKKKIVYA